MVHTIPGSIAQKQAGAATVVTTGHVPSMRPKLRSPASKYEDRTMNTTPFKILFRKTDKEGEHKLVILTDTVKLKQMLDESNQRGYAGHEITMPGSTVAEIIFEVTPPLASRERTHYVHDLKVHSDKLVKVSTL